MITNSQCERLKSMAQNIKPIFEISKQDIGVKEILDISIALDLHELIKISIHPNAKTNAKTFLNAICALTGAEPVNILDNEIVIYRHSLSNNIEHIEI